MEAKNQSLNLVLIENYGSWLVAKITWMMVEESRQRELEKNTEES